jgi:hypothetical protein
MCKPSTGAKPGRGIGKKRRFTSHFPNYTCVLAEVRAPTMGIYGCHFLIALALLIGGRAWAEEPKGFLGVELRDVTKDEADKLGLGAPRGVKVVKPRANGPAAHAGILADDVIISLDGQDVENMVRFVGSIGNTRPGAQVQLRLLRSGQERTVGVTLGQWTSPSCSSTLAGTWQRSVTSPSPPMADSSSRLQATR